MLNVNDLRVASTKHALTFGGVVLGLGALFALVFALVGAMLEIPFAGYFAGAIFFAFGMVSVVVIIQQYNAITRNIGSLVDAALDRLDAETRHRFTMAAQLPALPTPTNLPTEPQESRVIPVTQGERVGEVAVTLVNGFDSRDLDWFAKLLANGNRYSESALERVPLPYEGVLFGGLTDGTPLTRLLDLCEARSIMLPRDAKARKQGKLLITDEREIARRLKQI